MANLLQLTTCLRTNSVIALLFLLSASLILLYALPVSFTAPPSSLLLSPTPFLHNTTLMVACASSPGGKGNLLLPSGRRVHAFKDVFSSLGDGPACVQWVSFRTEKPGPTLVAEGNPGGRQWSNASDGPTPAHVYLALDSLADGAFIHWVAESGVFLALWDELRGLFPNLKLLLRRPKTFKSLILQAYGIDALDVEYYTGGWPKPGLPGAGELPEGTNVYYPTPNLVFSLLANISMMELQMSAS